jgi:hypothetical protein
MKEIKVKDALLTQEPDVFKDENTGKRISYFKYVLKLGNRDVSIKGVNAKAKVYLEDMFESLPEAK